MAAVALLAGAFGLQGGAGAAEGGVSIPAPAIDEPVGTGPETVVFAGGCFWGVQGVFQHVKGVESAVSGYAGGTLANPTYEQVGTERNRPCRVGEGHLRSEAGLLRQAPADLLLGRSQPDRR